MAKKTNKPTTQKKSAPTKKETKPAKPVAAPPKEEVIEAEVIDTPVTKNLADVKIGDLTKGSVSGLDANHRVELNGQIIDLFVKNPSAQNKFGIDTVEAMTQIAAVGVITAVADEVINGSSTFAITVKREAYDALAQAAASLNITLPSLKSLPNKEDGTINLTAKEVKVSDETAKTLKEENTVVEKKQSGELEMDPKKVAELGEDAIKDSLTAILVDGLRKQRRSIKDVLVEAVDFMQALRIQQAETAKDSDLKQKYAERSMYEVLKDIFNYAKPLQLLGIGNGMMRLMEIEKSPLSAFVILRDQLLEKKYDPEHPDEEINACWDDQSIADTVRVLVEMTCDNHIKRFEGMIESDKDKKNKASYEQEIKRAKDVLSYLYTIDFSIIDEFQNTADLDEKSAAAKAFTKLMKSYYPKQCRTVAHYQNLNINLAQRAGIILNLFRNPGDKNQLYSEANILPIETLSIETATEKVKSEKLTIFDIPFVYRDRFPSLFAKKNKKESKKG